MMKRREEEKRRRERRPPDLNRRTTTTTVYHRRLPPLVTGCQLPSGPAHSSVRPGAIKKKILSLIKKFG
ncbi:unnamed protein product [Arabidopsis halleri]